MLLYKHRCLQLFSVALCTKILYFNRIDQRITLAHAATFSPPTFLLPSPQGNDQLRVDADASKTFVKMNYPSKTKQARPMA